MVRQSKSGQKLSVPTPSAPDRPQRANLDLFMECVDEDLAPSQQAANQIATTEYKTAQKHIETVNRVTVTGQRPTPRPVAATAAYKPLPSAPKTVPVQKPSTGVSKTLPVVARTAAATSKTVPPPKTALSLKTVPVAPKVPAQKPNASKPAAVKSKYTPPLILTLPKSVPPQSRSQPVAKNARIAKALKRK